MAEFVKLSMITIYVGEDVFYKGNLVLGGGIIV